MALRFSCVVESSHGILVQAAEDVDERAVAQLHLADALAGDPKALTERLTHRWLSFARVS